MGESLKRNTARTENPTKWVKREHPFRIQAGKGEGVEEDGTLNEL